MGTRTKVTILSLVFILSTVFFWLAINQYLLPSKAQLGSNLQIVPHSTNIECNPSGECYVHVLGSTDANNGVAGVTGHIQYGEFLEPVRIERSGICADTSYGLDMELEFTKNEQNRVITFSVGSIAQNSQLKGGNGCITTVVFQPNNLQKDPTETKLQLITSPEWKAGGTIAGVTSVLVPNVDQQPITVKISSSVPLPTGGPVPSVIPSPSTVPGDCRLDQGDCNCDDEVDLVDWESLRLSLNKESGAMCDTNSDGVVNTLDFGAWLVNNDLVRPVLTN